MGEARRNQYIKTLLDALRPFAKFTHETDPAKHRPEEIFVPTEGSVWLYVGEVEQLGKVHLHTDDFQRARALVLQSAERGPS